MNLIVVTERQATASIRMRRCNWLIALAFSAFIVSFAACAPSHDAPESASPAPSATATSDATPSSQQFPSEAKVVRVIDGVTIEVEHEGERFLVRYLGVSIPASADHAEASQFNQFIAQGKTVVLSSEDAGVDFDGAHLRYVFIDGEMVNLKLLNGGWGEVAQFPASFEKFEEFFKAESLARTDGRGIWSVEASSPVPSSSEATPQISRPTPSPNHNFVGGTLPARPGSPSGSGGGCEFSGS
ncbi:MAG TPA: thermonuclease family protein, partial [Gammaproteobacteria bacterium]|nr:thermonuclease family protein [Gammaproteobacteria bacterium]